MDIFANKPICSFELELAKTKRSFEVGSFDKIDNSWKDSGIHKMHLFPED